MKATLWFALVPGLASAQTALTLEEALATARRQAPSIVAAQAEARSKVGEWRAAQSNLGPKLTGNGFYADSRNGATLQTMGGMPDTTMAMPAGRTTVGNLMLMLPLYSGGLLESRSAAAKARAAAIEGEVQEVVAETLLAVKEAYLTALLGQERVAAQRARLKAVEEMLRTTQARFEEGKDLQASVLRVQTESLMARRDLRAAENSRDKALIGLQQVIGGDPGAPRPTVGALVQTENPWTLDDSLANALEHRGLVQAAQALIAAAQAEVRAATARSAPQVYGQAMADASGDPMMRGSTFGVVLTIPLYDGGERRAMASAMRAMVDRETAMLRGMRLEVETQVRQAWLDLQTAAQDVEAVRSSVTAAEAAYDVVRLRVEAGKGILLEQLDGLRLVAEARLALAQALFDHRLALARLERASGRTAKEQP